MPTSNFHSFQIDNFAIRYNEFAPRLFNFCLSLGMEPNRIMPSRAFCSDENQGYPIMLIASHFGSFPFNHGRVSGIVATDRNGPHAHHGKDMVIIQASHVGYDPETAEFGTYRRIHTVGQEKSTDCGAICGVLSWYQQEYDAATQQIMLAKENGAPVVIVDNHLLNYDRKEGLFLDHDALLENMDVIHSDDNASTYAASRQFIDRVGTDWPENKTPVGNLLYPDLFSYKREMDEKLAGGLLNKNLIASMPAIITGKSPTLYAALVHSQMEFDKTCRSIANEEAYRGKKVVFVAGVHIDVSPEEGQLLPLTQYVPLAAYIQNESGEGNTLKQKELFDTLMQQGTENPHRVDLTTAINKMEDAPDVALSV